MLICTEFTGQSGWHLLVSEAVEKSGYVFDDHLQNYLVMTLDHFMEYSDLAGDIIAIDFLEGIQIKDSTIGQQKLRKVGDQCLLISGLFPERLQKRNVSLGYYIHAGQHAYWLISQQPKSGSLDRELFYELSEQFTGLMDVLGHIRLPS